MTASHSLPAVVLLAGALACSPLASAPANTPTTPPPTETPIPLPTDTPTASPDEIVFDDPDGDCILNDAQVPVPCDPPEFDLLQVTIRRASPLVVILHFRRGDLTSGAGLSALADYTALHGLDLDRDATTGATGGWPEQHGVAPDILFVYQVDGGQATSGIVQYARTGETTPLDSSLAEWVMVDPYTLQLVVSDGVVREADFGIAGDMLGPVFYDHYVDRGHLEFPSGDVVMVP
jgi:hypothetical protein